jgi:methyl-accepting chemotaxis protein
MRAKYFTTLMALLVASLTQLSAQSKSQPAAPAPAGQGTSLKCSHADGQTPCTPNEVSDLNQDIADLKATFGDAKSTVGDAQQNVSDAQQVSSDAKQLNSDAKKPAANTKQTVSDAKQTASDTKQAYGDAQQTKSDSQQTVQDVQQNLQDAQQSVKDLKGIGSLALKALDGTLGCAQNDGTPCNENQIKALQTHAANKKPPLTVTHQTAKSGP